MQKFIEKLNAQEFRERFHVLYGIVIHFLGDDPMSTEQEPFNDIIFRKEKFNVGLCFPLPSLFKQFLHFTNIPLCFLYPNVVRILMGCSVLNMLYHLDLSLLEVLFIYTIKMSEKEIFQPVHTYSIPSTSDWTSRFHKGSSKRTCCCFGLLGQLI